MLRIVPLILDKYAFRLQALKCITLSLFGRLMLALLKLVENIAGVYISAVCKQIVIHQTFSIYFVFITVFVVIKRFIICKC